MATFFADAEAAAGGEFLDTAEVGIRYTLPAGTINSLRVYWPAVAPGGTPVMHLWSAGGTLLQTISFDTTALSGWNSATPTTPIAVSAGTYYVSWGTTRYKAILGFFSGGSVTRGSITAVEGRFASVGSFPASTSAAAYVADLDFTPSGGGGSAAPTGLAVPVSLGQPAAVIPGAAPSGLAVTPAAGQPTVTLNRTASPAGLAAALSLGTPAVSLARSAAPAGLATAVALGQPSVGLPGAAPSGVAVPVTTGQPQATVLATPSGVAVGVIVGQPSVSVARSADPVGIAVAAALGAPSAGPTAAVSRITLRPYAGTTARPNSGVTLRP